MNQILVKRVDRANDEKLYQPQIHSDRIRQLYRMKLATGLPLTVLVDQAISELVANYTVPTATKTLDEIKSLERRKRSNVRS